MTRRFKSTLSVLLAAMLATGAAAVHAAQPTQSSPTQAISKLQELVDRTAALKVASLSKIATLSAQARQGSTMVTALNTARAQLRAHLANKPATSDRDANDAWQAERARLEAEVASAVAALNQRLQSLSGAAAQVQAVMTQLKLLEGEMADWKRKHPSPSASEKQQLAEWKELVTATRWQSTKVDTATAKDTAPVLAAAYRDSATRLSAEAAFSAVQSARLAWKLARLPPMGSTRLRTATPVPG